ncbi:MAG: cation:proton antiporter, partial [Nitriliruptoraceae bacterium]
TDAALGEAVVTDGRVPRRIRQTLSTESGLNDGTVLPLVMLFLALAASAQGLESAAYWIRFILEQIGLGVLLGALGGAAGGTLIDRAVRAGWMTPLFRQLGTLALAVTAFASAEWVGGNGFVAAFSAGLAFGQVARDQCPHVADFAEDEGHLLELVTFLLFGAILAGPAITEATVATVGYAILSLTVVRMVPVALSLMGSGLPFRQVAFVSWFGPRGLASILFALVVLEEAALSRTPQILTVVTWTVLLSILAHGLSAAPWAAALQRPSTEPGR